MFLKLKSLRSYIRADSATEPAGTFRSEETLVAGSGVQKAFGWRWGDYAGLSVDPVDDCIKQTGEYYTQASEDFSDFAWLSRIGRFKFSECTPAPRYDLWYSNECGHRPAVRECSDQRIRIPATPRPALLDRSALCSAPMRSR